MKAILLLMALASVSALAFAQEFTCPSGQAENLQCAASCCEQNGGTYSYGDETCTVDSSAQLSAAFQCEREEGCCQSTGGSPGGSTGCCGAFILLALASVPALAYSHYKPESIRR